MLIGLGVYFNLILLVEQRNLLHMEYSLRVLWKRKCYVTKIFGLSGHISFWRICPWLLMLEDALRQLQSICIHVTVNVEIKINGQMCKRSFCLCKILIWISPLQAESAVAALNCSGAVLGSLPIRWVTPGLQWRSQFLGTFLFLLHVKFEMFDTSSCISLCFIQDFKSCFGCLGWALQRHLWGLDLHGLHCIDWPFSSSSLKNWCL